MMTRSGRMRELFRSASRVSLVPLSLSSRCGAWLGFGQLGDGGVNGRHPEIVLTFGAGDAVKKRSQVDQFVAGLDEIQVQNGLAGHGCRMVEWLITVFAEFHLASEDIVNSGGVG